MTTPSRNLMRSPKVRANLLASSLMPVNVWTPWQTPPPLSCSCLSRVNSWGDEGIGQSPSEVNWHVNFRDELYLLQTEHQRSSALHLIYLPAPVDRLLDDVSKIVIVLTEDRGRHVYRFHLAEFYTSFSRRCLQSNIELIEKWSKIPTTKRRANDSSWCVRKVSLLVLISSKLQKQERNPQKRCWVLMLGPDALQQGQTWTSGGRVNLYLHVLHKDLSSHAHLQHPVDDQFAVGREHVSAHVKVLEPLHFRVFTDWGIQMESEGTQSYIKNQREKRTK